MSEFCYCGTPEHELAKASRARWDKTSLSWSVQSDLPGILHDAFRTAIAEALAAWAAVCGLTFAEAPSPASADILIATGPIDGPQGILAYSELPPAAPVHQTYDTGETWRTATGQGISLPVVAMHELGHALGLDHDAQGSGSLMAPYYDPAITAPQPRDIAHIQSLYGPPRQQPAPPTSPAPTPTPTAPFTVRFPFTLFRGLPVRFPAPWDIAAGDYVFTPLARAAEEAEEEALPALAATPAERLVLTLFPGLRECELPTGWSQRRTA